MTSICSSFGLSAVREPLARPSFPVSTMPDSAPLRPLIIGVAGGSGSGKTTVARAITDPLDLDAVLIDADAYYEDLAHLTLEERKQSTSTTPMPSTSRYWPATSSVLPRATPSKNQRTTSRLTHGRRGPWWWNHET